MPRSIHDECIEWDGPLDKWFYGKVYDKKRHVEGKNYTGKAHRVVWEEERGPIPQGMCVLHRCDNPPCINIEHLFLGTIADNNRDMAEKGRGRNQNSLKTHCKRGHELSAENTIHGTSRGKPNRNCRACQRERWRNQYYKQRDAKLRQSAS